MLLLIDNYDSFSHNLARYLREAGLSVCVARNDAIAADAVCDPALSALVISPGPGRPENAGVSLAAIRALPPSTPLLGVCLGHQCLVEVFGGVTLRARRPLHGEASEVRRDDDPLFRGLPAQFPVGRYHSLISQPAANSPIAVIAQSEESEVMAVRHKERPWYGVQFHPESLLTPHGRLMIKNFAAIVAQREC